MATIDVKDAANVTQTLERPLAPGQALMAASRPVAIASNQSAVPISGTVTANAGTGTMAVSGTVTANAGTGTMTVSGTVAATQSGTWNIGSVTTMPTVTVTGTVTANVGTGTQPVSGTVAATQSGTWNIGTITTLPALVAGTANIGDVDVLTMPAVTVNGIATTAYDRGAGAATAQTTRVTVDTGQLGALVKGGVPTVSGGYDWFWIDVSQTNSALQNTTGATGDYLESVLCVVATPATCQVQIKDGSGTARTIFPANVGGGVGSYPVPIGAISKLGAWQISTQAGVTVVATGRFT